MDQAMVSGAAASGGALQQAPGSLRRLIFLSHATPEDNAFARWLAAQLANAGYEVWCDVTKLLGGEVFWKDIEDAIKHHTFRFLFASTLKSNQKAGSLKELEWALAAEAEHNLKDFVVPLKVDQFPFGSTHTSIKDRNFLRFDEGWASAFTQLLKLLEREGAPKSSAANPGCVAEWYRKAIDKDRKPYFSNNRCFSNWLSLELPKHIYFHEIGGTKDQRDDCVASFPFPRRPHADGMFAFAIPPDAQNQIGPLISIKKSTRIATKKFIYDGNTAHSVKPGEAQKIVSDLLRQAWEGEMSRRGLSHHALASGIPAWFFKKNQLPKDKAFFVPPGGKRTYRQLVGMKRRRDREGVLVSDGCWHYAVSGVPQIFPEPHFVLRHHVVFTEDGENLWKSPERMHRARRKVCKDWWNPQWRDRLLAFCAWLGGDAGTFALPLSDNVLMSQAAALILFNSQWTYLEDGQEATDENQEIELIEDIDEGDEEENVPEEELAED